MANQQGGRAVVQDLQQPSYKPTPVAGSIYAPPAKRDVATPFQQLAQSLSGLQPELQKFTYLYDKQQKQDADEQAAAAYAGMTRDEFHQAVKDGKVPPFASGAYRDETQRIDAISMAHKTGEDLKNAYLNHPDKANLDVDDFLAKGMTPDISGLASDREKAIYAKTIGPTLQAIRGQHVTDISTALNKKNSDDLTTNFRGQIEQGVNGGLTPEQISAGIWKSVSDQKEWMSFDKQHESLMLSLKQLAMDPKGQFNSTIRAVMNDDRDGQGALAKTQQFTDQAFSLNQHMDHTDLKNSQEASVGALTNLYHLRDSGQPKAVQAAMDQFNKDFPNVLPWHEQAAIVDHAQKVYDTAQQKMAKDADYIGSMKTWQGQRDAELMQDRLAGKDGTLNQLGERQIPAKPTKQDETPDTVKIQTQDQRVKAVAQAEEADWGKREATIAQFVKSGQMSQQDGQAALQQVQDDRAHFYTANGVVNEAWKKQLSGAPSGLTADGQFSPTTIKNFEFYNYIHGFSPNYVANQLVTNLQVRDQFEFYRVAREDMNKTPQEALKIAQSFSAPDNLKADEATWKEREKDLDAAVKNVSVAGGGWWSGTDGSDYSMVAGDIRRMARIYYHAGGLSPDQAIKAATDQVDKTFTRVNGTLVPTRDMAIPQNFRPQSERYLDMWAQAQGSTYGSTDGSDYTVRPVPGSPDQFNIWQKNGQGPTSGVMSLQNLRNLDDYDRYQAQQKKPWIDPTNFFEAASSAVSD